MVRREQGATCSWSYGTVRTHVHVLLSREERLARRVQQQHTLDRVEGAEDQEVVLTVGALGHETVEGVDEPQGDVPLEALLELEELPEGRVVGQVRQGLAPRTGSSRVVPVVVVAAGGGADGYLALGSPV